jgi:hypothetical protein
MIWFSFRYSSVHTTIARTHAYDYNENLHITTTWIKSLLVYTIQIRIGFVKQLCTLFPAAGFHMSISAIGRVQRDK